MIRPLPRIVLAVLFLSTTACADEAAVKKALGKRFPDMPIASVNKAPVKGLYEVVAGQQVFYVDAEVRHVILGNIIDVEKQRNLTNERREALMRVDFAQLPFDNAIEIVRGKGTRRIAIFEDPDCPYCRKLEADLAQMDDLTIYVFLYPLDQLHPEAGRKARQVWCAPDRARAWLDVMLKGKLPDNDGNCPNPVAATIALAQKLNIQGTPAIVFENGRLVPGAVPKERLEALLDEAQRQAGGRR